MTTAAKNSVDIPIKNGSPREDFFLSLQSKYPCRAFAEFTLSVTNSVMGSIHLSHEVPYVGFWGDRTDIKVLVMIEGLNRKDKDKGYQLTLRGYLKWNTDKWDNRERSYLFSATFNTVNRKGTLTFC